MTGVVLLFGCAAVAVWAVRRHLAAVDAQPRHVHRPIVVQDGQVDVCESCGERLVNW